MTLPNDTYIRYSEMQVFITRKRRLLRFQLSVKKCIFFLQRKISLSCQDIKCCHILQTIFFLNKKRVLRPFWPHIAKKLRIGGYALYNRISEICNSCKCSCMASLSLSLPWSTIIVLHQQRFASVVNASCLVSWLLGVSWCFTLTHRSNRLIHYYKKHF